MSAPLQNPLHISTPAPVLVVAPAPESRLLLEQALAEAGLQSVWLKDGAEAMAWLSTRAASLLLLDLEASQAAGYALLQKLRTSELTAKLPVVVLTALDSDQDVEQALTAGADDFVRKPFRAAELTARIRSQLRMRGYIEALAQKERDAQVVLELTQALASSLELRQILFTVVQRIAEVAHVDRCSIVLVQESGTVGHVAATSDDQQLHDLVIELDKYPEIQQVLGSGNALVIENVATHPLLDMVRQELPPGAVASLAILPIVYENRTMGVLFLRARQAMSLGEQELSIARTVANATAIALRNARVIKRLRDKTERVTFARFKAERRLRLLKRYAAFFESGADGILVTDVDWHILFSNARARSLLGYSDMHLRRQRFDELVPEEDKPRMSELQQGFAQGLYPQNSDIRLRRADGSSLVLSTNFSSVLRDDSVVLLSFRDVTRERAVDTELKQTKDFLERVIGSSVNAIISVDRSGIVRLFNRAAERCFAYPADEVVGKMRATSLFPDESASEVIEILSWPEDAGPMRIEDHRTYVLSATQELVPVSLSAALIYEEGRSAGAVIIFTDLRDKLRMEARLAAAQEELQTRERQALLAELAGAAAHELNQPLTSVMGYAELLKRQLERDTPTYAATEVILNEAERMAEIVRKIGKITRYATKNYVGEAKILDLDRASEDIPPSARR